MSLRFATRSSVRVKAFDEKAYALGLDARKVKTANYLICALIDDIVLNTPWGAHGPWPAQTLCGTLHQDVAYGDRVFDLLQELRRRLEQERDLLQLIHLCLLLGFEGKYRRDAGGRALVADITDDLGRLLGCAKPKTEPLSPDWQGVVEPYQPLNERLPFWVAAVATSAVLLLIYAGFALHLSSLSEPLKVLIADLPPQGEIQLISHQRNTESTTAIAPRFIDQLKTDIDGFLVDDRQSGSVETFEDAQSVTIRVLATGEDIFASGKASLNAGYTSLIERIAEALRQKEGLITVSGHSDDRPIRTARFTSNWALSEARAQTVCEPARRPHRHAWPHRLCRPGRYRADRNQRNRERAHAQSADRHHCRQRDLTGLARACAS